MPKGDRYTMAGETTPDTAETRTRSGRKSQPKKRFELDEDMSDFKITPNSRKSSIHKFLEKKSNKITLVTNGQISDTKENIDLSKYKDEYKDLIESVKNNCQSKSVNVSTGKNEMLKDDTKESELNGVTGKAQAPTTPSTSSTNAFFVMMEARKRSIGMNSPGKEVVEEQKEPDELTTQKEIKAKRLLALSLMAEKKGASKRKELEELREENNKNVLDKRSDSFKKMLQKGGGAKQKVKKTESEKLKDAIKDYEDIFQSAKQTKELKKRRRDSTSKCESDDAPIKKSKTVQPKTPSNKVDLNVAQNKEEIIDSKEIINNKKLNNSGLSEEDENFLKNLSPSLKKTESVLCYFTRTPSEMGISGQCVDSDIVEVDNESSQTIKVKFTPKRKNKKKILLRKLSISKKRQSTNVKNKDDMKNVIDNKMEQTSGSSEQINITDGNTVSTTDESITNNPDTITKSTDVNITKNSDEKNINKITVGTTTYNLNENITKSTDENPTNNSNEKITKSTDENPTNNSDEKITKSADENPTNNLDVKITESTDENPTNNSNEKITESTNENPSNNSNEKITKSTDENPTNNSNEKITESTDENPTNNSNEKITKSTDENPTNNSDEKITKSTNENPTNNSDEKITESTDENPTNNSNENITKSTHGNTNKTTDGNPTNTDENTTNKNTIEVQKIEIDSPTPQRPRRSVRKPVKYMQESSETSDTDNEEMFNTKKQKRNVIKTYKKKTVDIENVLTIEIDDKVSPLKIINLQSPGQLKCVKSPKVASCDLRKDAKLAPLFRKNIPKPKVDPSVVEARRLFLQSGVPDVMKKHLERSNSNIINQDIEEFHTVCHVQQLTEDNATSEDKCLPLQKYLPQISPLQLDDIVVNITDFKDGILISSTPSSNSRFRDLFNKLESYSFKQGLRELKQANPNFPIFKSFKQLWEKFTALPKYSKMSSQDSGVFGDEITSATSDVNNINGFVWTERYKPLSSHDIIGNFQALSSIKRWLEVWKEYNETATSKVVKKSRRDSSSSSDFENSDSESGDSSRSPCNVMVITGPPGSGKTSSIYAICNELGINVLEVNSSSRRTGKKILSDMHEATQSHKVLTKQSSDCCFTEIFPKSNNDTSSKSEPRSLSQMKKIISKSKDKISKSINESVNGNSDSQKIPEGNVMSIMVIDDADVVFEEDDGFIGALSQLVQSSKRPVLLVASDNNSPHLQKFMSDSNTVQFKPLSGKILGPWIDVLILIECNKIIPGLAANLLELYKGDMRKCLLQLQYWIGGSKNTNTDEITSSPMPAEGFSDSEESNASWIKSDCSYNKATTSDIETAARKALLLELFPNFNLEQAWWRLDDVLKTQPLVNITNKINSQVQNSHHKELKKLHKYLDTFSDTDLIQSNSKCTTVNLTAPPWKGTLKDSLSESENKMMYDSYAKTSEALCQYVQEHSVAIIKDMFEDCSSKDVCHIESLDIRANEKKLKIYDDFSQGVAYTSLLDRGSVAMDYMPTLRCISRSEKSRSVNNSKRNNRFHNYLNTLNITTNGNTLNSACRIFNDC